MRLFNANLKMLPKMFLKKKLWQAATLALMAVLLSPFIVIYQLFTAYRNKNVYFLSRTSQVVHIEAVLNDRWDKDFRRITIEDETGLEPVYVYREDELKAAPYIYLESEGQQALNLNNDNELYSVTPDFKVNVPVDIVFDTDEMIALVRKYCLAGKVFIIQQV